MSNHCLDLSSNCSSIFSSPKSNPRFKLSNSTFFSLSPINHRAKSRLSSASSSSSFSTFPPCLNRKGSVLNSISPVSDLADSTKSFSPGKRTDLKKILILGAGPIVIGQACEFDYSGTQACKALREEGYQVILINSNPATIMTDPETANRTYIAPMTPELVEQVIQKERPDALLPTMGGQTALNLAVALAESGALEKYGVELIGAKLGAIKKAEDRELFKEAMKNIGLKTPPSGIGNTLDECFDIAERIGEFPLIIRPAFTLGGTGGGIAYNKEEFESICKAGLAASVTSQVLVEKSLLGWKEYELEVMRDLADNVVIICSIENIDPMGVHTSDAIEIDVDTLTDSYGNVVIGGIMEHIEQAGVHSGDSACILPTQTIPPSCLQTIRTWTTKLAKKLNVCGLMNCQYAITSSGDVFLLEANPRASRTVPFVSKAIGHPLAKYAALVMSGKSLKDLNFEEEVIPKHVSVKEAVFPFEKFQGCDVILGPEMRSTGEVMSISSEFPSAFAMAQIAAGQKLPLTGTVFLSLNDLTKPHLEKIAVSFIDLGFKIVATSGTAHFLELKGIPVERVLKLHEGRPHAADMVANGQIHLMLITSSGDALDQKDGRELRQMALAYKVPVITTVAGALATAEGIKSLKSSAIQMTALQDFFKVKKESSLFV